jgi:hypothetical protein
MTWGHYAKQSYFVRTFAIPYHSTHLSHLNASSDKRGSCGCILLVVQVSSSDARTTLADVVARVADGQDLGRGDLAESASAVGVTEVDDWIIVNTQSSC